jgi:hypothetical protein
MAVTLNGTTQYLSAGVDTKLDYPSPITFSGWVKPANKGSQQGLFCHGRDNSGSFQAYVEIISSGAVRQYCGGNDNTRYHDSTELVDWDAWNLVTCSWNGAAMALWVNGVKSTFTSVTAYSDGAADTYNLVLGAVKTTTVGRLLQGKQSQCAVASVAASDTNANDLLTIVPNTVFAGSLLSYWEIASDGTDSEALNNLSGVDGPSFSTSDEPPVGGPAPNRLINPRWVSVGYDVRQLMLAHLK